PDMPVTAAVGPRYRTVPAPAWSIRAATPRAFRAAVPASRPARPPGMRPAPGRVALQSAGDAPADCSGTLRRPAQHAPDARARPAARQRPPTDHGAVAARRRNADAPVPHAAEPAASLALRPGALRPPVP